MADNDIIIEFLQQGRYVKVSAFDSQAMIEVSIVGDPSKGEDHLRDMVLKKLEFVLNQKKSSPSSTRKRGGIIV
jgi:hypothetical protein|tara:strand:+ start:888 stop:1109 length:222 start_codon:yes stop_codon:yes gene_type:complete